jgi:hypothetical protein
MMQLVKWAALTAAVLVTLGQSALQAQARDTRPISEAAVAMWNADGTTRVIGTYDVPAGREVRSDVGVLNGPATISGRIVGTLVAINSDVRLERGASITGNVVIVGGSLRRANDVTISGEVRTQADLLRYSMNGEMITADDVTAGEWRPRLAGREDDRRQRAYTDLFFVAARTYNRVEGLPITVGPRFRRTTGWGRVQVEAFGVARTAEPVRWDRGSIGHDARAELRVGRGYGLVLGGRLFDVVEPIEAWQLRNSEVGLLTFLAHRDLRDHYGRHGAEGSIGGRIGEEVSLTVAFGSERWRSVTTRNPLALRNDRQAWRLNPAVDEGTIDLISTRFSIDTRERVRAPWLGGWFISANVERGRGTLARALAPALGVGTPTELTYTRGFMDARRYTNISPGTELNLRIVAGGQLGGNELPLQRKLSVGGPGSVEGYDFRRAQFDDDVFTCGGIAAMPGRATLCDRIGLAQVELRQDFHVSWVRTDRQDDWWRPGLNGRGQWVLFADAGRGWTVGDGAPAIRQDRGIPALNTFRTSLGLGVDFGGLGFYVAKSVSTPQEGVNVLVRLGRRF